MDNIQYPSVACNRMNFQVAPMNSAFRLTFTDQQSMLSDFQSLSQSQKPKTVLRLIQRAGIIDLVVLKMPQSFGQLNNCTNNYKIITSSVFSSLRQTSQLYQLFLWHNFEIVPCLAFPSLSSIYLVIYPEFVNILDGVWPATIKNPTSVVLYSVSLSLHPKDTFNLSVATLNCCLMKLMNIWNSSSENIIGVTSLWVG